MQRRGYEYTMRAMANRNYLMNTRNLQVCPLDFERQVRPFCATWYISHRKATTCTGRRKDYGLLWIYYLRLLDITRLW
jgi:hypothetical protein